MTRFMICLSDDEARLLNGEARRERRDLREQAAVFVRQGLEQIGLLPPAQNKNPFTAQSLPAHAVNGLDTQTPDRERRELDYAQSTQTV